MGYWKITNNQDVNTKVAVATASNGSVGVILKPKQFCVCKDQMTKMLDAQMKRGFVLVERNFSNELDLETGVPFDEGFTPEKHADQKVKEYKSGK